MLSSSAKPASSLNDFIKLVREDGHVQIQGASDGTQKGPSCINVCSKDSDELQKSVRTKAGYDMTGSANTSKTQVQDLGPNKKVDFLNFSQFIRPTVLFKTRWESTKDAALGMKEKRFVGDNSKHGDFTLVESSNNCSKVPTGVENHPVSAPSKTQLRSTSSDELPKEHSPEEICRKKRIVELVIDKTSSFSRNAVKGICPVVKSNELIAVASSVCSHKVPEYQTCHTKRKYQRYGKSACPEIALKAPRMGGKTGGRRTRVAEVHNQSERKRRDNINKKMRALQELIPNCHKIDKVSILDEAIDYLRTLKLQLQLMSTQSGMYMPQMMLPAAMQQIYAPHMAHFSPMGVGLGMRIGMGMGMGMGAEGSQEQFSSSPIAGITGFSGATLQSLGISSHAMFPMSMSNAPFVPTPGGASTESVLEINPDPLL